MTAVVAGQRCTWTERRLVIRSLAQARAGEAALRTRLAQAQTALADLQTRRQGKPRCTELPAVREAAEAILARYRVQGLLRLHYEEYVCERPVRRYGLWQRRRAALCRSRNLSGLTEQRPPMRRSPNFSAISALPAPPSQAPGSVR